MSPTIEVINELGGSANTDEIYEKIVEKFQLSDSLHEVVNGKTGQSELQYNLSWVRTILKNKGLLKKVGWGIWVIGDNTQDESVIDNEPQLEATDEEEADEEVSDAESWKQKAIDVITDKLRWS